MKQREFWSTDGPADCLSGYFSGCSSGAKQIVERDGFAIYFPPSLVDRAVIGESSVLDWTGLQKRLGNELNFGEQEIRMFGKWVKEPRLVSCCGDPGVRYRYSGRQMSAPPWTPTTKLLSQAFARFLSRFFEQVENKRFEISNEVNFNFVLANLYRDGNDYAGEHSDDEKELGPRPLIASLSLGAERDFFFRHKQDKEKIQISLEPGSLLVMGNELQKNWKHGLPKRKKVKEARVNLTFRQINSGSGCQN